MSFLILASPRSGSTLLTNFLKSSYEIDVAGELLNSNNSIEEHPLNYLKREWRKMTKKMKGFKLFPEQLVERNIRFDDLINTLDVKTVVVIWRKNILEQFVSLEIAEKTGVWHTFDSPTTTEKIILNEDKLQDYVSIQKQYWRMIAEQWPLRVAPVFVNYEDLIQNTSSELKRIFDALLCEFDGEVPPAYSAKQNPAPLCEKVINWNELSETAKNIELNYENFLSELLRQKLHAEVGLPAELSHLIPDREPLMPSTGWVYRVCEPYISNLMKKNVIESIYTGSVSSASRWPKIMANKFKALFGSGTAIPCSNGFTALLLSLQVLDIGDGDEVILPSMTMIAVANAVHFLGAKPVFVDNAPGKYNPGWNEIRCAITERTKAVIVTHTYGVPCHDLLTIVVECKKLNLWLIEDISECVGIEIQVNNNEIRLLGTLGDIAAASLYANKIVHGGDGGIILAKEPSLAPRLNSLLNHGFTPSFHFLHFESAINAKMNGIGAAIACACIDEVKIITKHRQKLAQKYRELLSNTPLKLTAECGSNDAPWVFGVECRSKVERYELRKYLSRYGIETRDFFFPLHLQPAFRTAGSPKRLVNSEHLGSTGFYLPIHHNIEIEDVIFISSAIVSFFSNTEMKLKPPFKQPKCEIIIEPGSNFPTLMTIKNGEVLNNLFCDYYKSKTLMLGHQLNECLVFDRWDSRQKCLNFIEGLKSEDFGENLEFRNKNIQPYVDYFKSEEDFEPSAVKPWLHVDLDSEIYKQTKEVPTTTNKETLQMLAWLVEKVKPKTIVEFGCWLGHASILMALAARESTTKVYSCDAFLWQEWMPNDVKNQYDLTEDKSFLHLFKTFTEKYREIISPVEWSYDCNALPKELADKKVELIFIDITQDAEELEEYWKILEPLLIPDESIVVFNGLTLNSIPFFTRHRDQLVSYAKPATIAKAFKYCSVKSNTKKSSLKRVVKFCKSPDWGHHHNNAFAACVNKLKSEVHADDATVLFAPSVEDTLCDNPALFVNNPWIGIVHEVVEHPEQFYYPDLKRMCSHLYQQQMKNCKGLFTLTTYQRDFLEKHLSTPNKIPIQTLNYPIIDHTSVESQVLRSLKENSEIDLVFIGSFSRDFKLFYDAKVPSYIRKKLLIGDEAAEEERKKAPPEVSIMERLNDEEYEEMLKKSIVFLALKYDGAANTVILECIARNVPIVVPAMRSTVEYIGEKYPL
ncbi:uncharacterized protein B4U79_00388, partial [Dinothrombium tinctorium]